MSTFQQWVGVDDAPGEVPPDLFAPHPLDPDIESSFQTSRVTEDTKTTKSKNTGPKLWMATDLKPAEPTRWLLRGHLPQGAVAVLVGDEGIGKSLWWVLIVAHITTGMALPDLGLPAREPRDVLLILTEDSWTGEVRTRLEVAGADFTRLIDLEARMGEIAIDAGRKDAATFHTGRAVALVNDHQARKATACVA